MTELDRTKIRFGIRDLHEGSPQRAILIVGGCIRITQEASRQG